MRISDAIIFEIDINKDVQTQKSAQRLKALGLRDLILTTHPHTSPLATQTPINRIFGTEIVEIFQVGYISFNAE